MDAIQQLSEIVKDIRQDLKEHIVSSVEFRDETKEDLHLIKGEVKKTNGRVTNHDELLKEFGAILRQHEAIHNKNNGGWKVFLYFLSGIGALALVVLAWYFSTFKK